tara:strand:- start:548 stop:730 length:183 start_codon:yes stop_codon:yes gene_type:complete
MSKTTKTYNLSDRPERRLPILFITQCIYPNAPKTDKYHNNLSAFTMVETFFIAVNLISPP